MADKSSKNIVAKRDGQTREFAPEVWNQLPEGKYGWKLASDEPAEVKNLKEGGSDPDATGAATKTSTGTGTEAEPKLNAADLAQKIYAAETVEAVDALVPDGEIRKTVLQAAEDRKKQLSETK